MTNQKGYKKDVATPSNYLYLPFIINSTSLLDRNSFITPLNLLFHNLMTFQSYFYARCNFCSRIYKQLLWYFSSAIRIWIEMKSDINYVLIFGRHAVDFLKCVFILFIQTDFYVTFLLRFHEDLDAWNGTNSK